MAARAKYAESVGASTKETEGYLEAYGKTVLLREERETLAKFHSTYDPYKELRGKAVSFALEGQNDKAQAILDGEARQLQTEARNYLRALIEINARVAEEGETSSTPQPRLRPGRRSWVASSWAFYLPSVSDC